MSMAKIRYLLFDAANTLIHKPSLWERIQSACEKHDVFIDSELLRRNHKILSELTAFPDRTTSDFYMQFNRELLYACGVIPSEILLSDIFEFCSYLPWEPFDDTEVLSKIDIPKGIISNFNTSLSDKLNQFFPNQFSKIITSEELQCAKPAPEFYEKATAIIAEDPNQIMFIGDSVKLDIEPALKAGWNALLIDRSGYYQSHKQRISSLNQLEALFHD